jgi:hypothetical protein
MIPLPRRPGDPKVEPGGCIATAICLLMLGLGIAGLVGSFLEPWAMATLRDRGVQTRADVRIDSIDHTSITYRYSFEVAGRTYGGTTSRAAEGFAETYQKNERPRKLEPMHVGTVAVTYLPDNPERHELGVVDDARLAKARRHSWLLLGGGVLFTLVGLVLVAGNILMWLDRRKGASADQPTEGAAPQQPPSAT